MSTVAGQTAGSRESRPFANVIRSFWQSPIVMEELNRRITGDPGVTPLAYFRNHYCPEPRRRGLSLTASGHLESEFVAAGACERMLGIDLEPGRLEAAERRVPEELRERVSFEVRDLRTWHPSEPFDLIVAKGSLDDTEDLEEYCSALGELLSSEGLLYVDQFVGPTRFQWTDRQLAITNRLLERLPPRLRFDLVTGDGSLRGPVGRPELESFSRANPTEAVRSSDIIAVLDSHLDQVECRPYGGALYHQFFNRIMGNFAGEDPNVRLIMEFDAILTEEGVFDSDYVWAVYRRRPTE
jgi:SAM-dependent methyltransferase